MGRSSLLILGGWCSCLLAVGCTLPLDATDAGTDAPIAPDAIEGCALFAGAAPSLGVGHSLDLPNGATLWTFDGALVDGGRSDGIAGRVQIQTDGCPGALVDAQIALPPSATDTDFAVPLDLVRVGADVWQFYETWRFAAGAPFGVKTVGRGIARWDAQAGRFTRSPLLWTGDRPAYGASALVDGAWVYAYGCEAANDGWTRACYAARAPSLQVADINAWQYATAVGKFTGNPDDAQPILTGVGDVSLRRHASGRLLVTYFKPLDSVLQVRSALGPTGPFSAPHALGQCQATSGTFCVGAVQHPELDGDDATIAVTFARASFDPLPAADRWPRLARLPLPVALP